jgi:hypothetical protein
VWFEEGFLWIYAVRAATTVAAIANSHMHHLMATNDVLRAAHAIAEEEKWALHELVSRGFVFIALVVASVF